MSIHPRRYKKHYSINTQYENPLPTTITDSDSYYDWTCKHRPIVEGHQNFMQYLPHWKEIYQDDWYHIQLKIARQAGKTTYNMGFLAYMSTTRPASVTNYITKDDASLTAMSTRKYRFGVLKSNKDITQLVRGKTELHKVEFLNDAMTNLGTHAHGFAQFVGKSGDATLIDEGQDIDWTGYANLKETQSFTQGPTKITGVGGILGSDYSLMWKRTDQRQWHFDNNSDYTDSDGKVYPEAGWRNDLQYSWQRELKKGEFVLPQSDLIYGPYLLKAMKGKWVAKHPENSERHGYKMTQYLMPNLALSVADAENIYHSNPEYAISAKWDEYTPAERQMYILAEDTEGASKPFTVENVKACFVPEKRFVLPEDIDYSLGPVIAGIDWGGGKTAFTVVTIAQITDMVQPVIDVLYMKKLPPMPSDEDIAVEVIDILNRYKAQPIAQDGWGITHCVQRLEGYFGSRARKVRYLKRPQSPLPSRQEFKTLKRKNLFEIDRSWAIEKIKNILEEFATVDGELVPRLQLPGGEDIQFVIDHLTAVEGEVVKINGKQYMEYDHPAGRPDDTLHTFVNLFVCYLLLARFGGHGRRASASIEMEYASDKDFINDIATPRHNSVF